MMNPKFDSLYSLAKVQLLTQMPILTLGWYLYSSIVPNHKLPNMSFFYLNFARDLGNSNFNF